MSKPQETPVRLRTRHWYDGSSRDNYIHRSWMKRGLPDDSFSGKPMIGICNSASDLAPCNQHLRELAEFVPASPLVGRDAFFFCDVDEFETLSHFFLILRECVRENDEDGLRVKM